MHRGALSGRSFRLLFFGQGISAIGDKIVLVALAFAVLDLTGSVRDLGIVLGAQTVALVSFLLVGGVWADRLPRRAVMMASDLIRAFAQGASAALLIVGVATVWELAILQAGYGMAQAFFGPAASALIPDAAPPEHLQQANALMGMSMNVAEVVGPAIAGGLLVLIGAGWGLAVDAATFVVSAITLWLMRVTESPPRDRTSIFTELREGWRAFVSRRWLWISAAYSVSFVAIAVSPLQVLGPQVARASLGGAPAWAAVSSAIGIGAVAGGVAALRWHPRFPLRVAFLISLVSTPALLGLLGAAAPLELIVAAGLLEGVVSSLFNVFWFTALQRDVPASELSRVSSWDWLGTYALKPVGLATTGPIAVAIGIPATLYGSAALLVLLTLAVLSVSDIRNFRGSWAAVA